MFQVLLNNITNLFFPPVCAGCHSFLVSNENVICTLCRHDIPLTNHHLNIENESFNKFYGRIPLEHSSAMLYFHKTGMVQEMIHNLKYKGQEEIGTVLGQWYAEHLKNLELFQTIDEIIPVPLHKRKHRERGYNQVTNFGLSLSNGLNIKYNPNLLVRNIYSKTQSKKSFFNRSEGIDTIFDVIFTEKDHNKHFLLIDDVLTTGSTLEACSKVLLKIPGAKISIVCMAMAHS